MRSLWRDVLTALLMGMVLPGSLLSAVVGCLEGTRAPEPTTAPTTAPRTVALPMRLRQGEQTAELDMDEYLVGVVLAEMPADFEEEALKAQAVAARTYTRKAWETGGKHGDGSVCADSACCQAYIVPEDYLAQGGTQEGLDKVRAAVLATSGYVLTYEGALIEATYFSCSGGSTEDALAVWGTDYPYLRAVDSPGEEGAARYRSTRTFTPAAFAEALGAALTGPPQSWFAAVTYTDGGGVAAMTIGEQSYAGTLLRRLLGLDSTAFSVAVSDDAITITTRGYGHRVGMSQYGADAMALDGSTWQEILAYYYPGTEPRLLEGE